MTGDKRVNDLLHNLRGEHFRRTQNICRSSTHVARPLAPVQGRSDDKNPPAGPRPPKSWTCTHDTHATPAWRARALSLVIPALASSRLPSLTSLCLRVLASMPAHEFTQDVVPWLAPHLRRDLVRDMAVHEPLAGTKLWPLYEPDHHADTELIVVSPQALLRDDYFIRGRGNREARPDDWDTDQGAGAEPLGTLVLISVRLAMSTLLSLPPTITRMALLSLPAPIPLHRLPNTCPLLVVLDLSYNSWLNLMEDSDKAFERVEWSRWNDLRILGLRECAVSSTILGKLNRGRWDDVEVVQ